MHLCNRRCTCSRARAYVHAAAGRAPKYFIGTLLRLSSRKLSANAAISRFSCTTQKQGAVTRRHGAIIYGALAAPSPGKLLRSTDANCIDLNIMLRLAGKCVFKGLRSWIELCKQFHSQKACHWHFMCSNIVRRISTSRVNLLGHKLVILLLMLQCRYHIDKKANR
jgi:hypothetical protein